jgi:hypothetical protein
MLAMVLQLEEKYGAWLWSYGQKQRILIGLPRVFFGVFTDEDSS